MPEDKLSTQHHQVIDTYHDPFADHSMTPRDTILRPYTVGASITITLPKVSDCAGRFYSIMAGAIVSPYTITIQDDDDSVEWTDKVLADSGRSYLLYSDGMSWVTQNTELFRHKTSSRTIGMDILSHDHLTQDTVVVGAGQTVVYEARLTSEVKTGAWANAIHGIIDYGTSGAAHGMAAAISAEMIPPNGSLSRGGLYSLEATFGVGASSSWGSAGPVAFMNFENWGTQTYFDTNAHFFRISRSLEGVGNMVSLNAHTIRIRLDGSVAGKIRYLVLSTVENSLTMVTNHTAVTERSINITTTQSATAGTHIANRFQLTPSSASGNSNSYTMNVRNTVDSGVTVLNQRAIYIESEVGGTGIITGAMVPLHIETWTSGTATVAEAYGIWIQHYVDVNPAGSYDGIRIDHNGGGTLDGFLNFRGASTSTIRGNANCTNLVLAEASGDLGCTVAADGMTADPQGGAEDGYITISVGGVSYQVPFYTA